MQLKRELGLKDLILLNIVAIVGLRWISKAAAEGGISSISLWLLAALVFFIPQGLTVMELSRLHPSEGGIYKWAQFAFGKFHSFICGWCYWTNNLIYYPTLLIFMAGIAVYIGGDRFTYLENNNIYNIVFCLLILWILVGLNIIGMKAGKWIQNIGALSTWVPILIIFAGGISVTLKTGFPNPFTFKDTIPNFCDLKTITFFSTMCFGFAGLEIGALMADEIKEPRKNLPRAIIIAGLLIALIYIGGTLSLLAALPKQNINVITGVIQTISVIGEHFGLEFLTSIIAFFMVIGGMGGSCAWLAGSARIPFVAGLDNFLPPSFTRIHPKWQTPYVAILYQGIFSSIFIVIAIVGSSVSEAYNILLTMTIIVYFIPYIYMFLSLIVLKSKEKDYTGMIPGGKIGTWIVGITGLLITIFSIFLSFIPPEETKNIFLYELKLIGGSLIFLVFAIILYNKNKIYSIFCKK